MNSDLLEIQLLRESIPALVVGMQIISLNPVMQQFRIIQIRNMG